MADFNAYPELDIKPIDYSAIPTSEANLAALKQRTQQSADEFPLLQQARQQQNELGALDVSQAKTQNRYMQLLQATQTVNQDDPQAAPKQWDSNLQALADAAPDEASKNFFKQYIGHYSQTQAENIGKMYAAKPAPGAKTGAAAASGLGVSPPNALAQPIGLSEEQQARLQQMPPAQLQPLGAAADQMLEDVRAVKGAGANAPAAWAFLQRQHPAAAARGPWSPQLMDQLEAEAMGVKNIVGGLLGPQTYGLGPAGPPHDIKTGAQGQITDITADEQGKPLVKELRGPEKAQLPANYEHIGDTKNGLPILLDKTTGKTIVGDQAIGTDQYNKGTDADAITNSELSQTDPTSGSILAQTGLSMPGFLAITGQSQRLSRDKATRDAAFKQAENFANARGVDVSTFGSQYKAYNDTLEKNIERNNQTKIMEGELAGTVDNLKPVADAALTGRLRVANVGKLFLGQEVNDPIVQQYSFQLHQLREELAAYNGALQGRTGSGLTKEDYSQAEDVIKKGLDSGGAGGLAKAVNAATTKMTGVLENNIDNASQSIWRLFGVGDKYKSKFGTADVAKPPPDFRQAPDGNFYKPDPARQGKYLMWQPDKK